LETNHYATVRSGAASELLNLAYTRQLLTLARTLDLDSIDRVKLLASYYLSRIPGLPRPKVLQLHATVEGQKMSLNIRPNGTDVGVLSDIFYKRLYKFEASNVQTVLDLGTNIGLATAYFSRRFPGATFACVEPSPANAAVIAKTVRDNNLNVRIFQAAIGLTEGTAKLHLSSDPSANSLDPAHSSSDFIEVRLLPVSAILKEMRWDRINLMKIDIEGYEKTLFGANPEWLSRVDTIVGEIHSHVGYTMEALRGDLAPYGFSVTELSGGDAEFGLTIFLANRQIEALH
jgi:FkbM family methyltransferase